MPTSKTSATSVKRRAPPSPKRVAASSKTSKGPATSAAAKRATPGSAKTTGKRASGSDKSKAPKKGGDQARKAQEWGGGSKGSKGPITAADKRNQNSSARSGRSRRPAG